MTVQLLPRAKAVESGANGGGKERKRGESANKRLVTFRGSQALLTIQGKCGKDTKARGQTIMNWPALHLILIVTCCAQREDQSRVKRPIKQKD